VVTANYTVGMPTQLPVLCLTCDPGFLHDPKIGILRHPDGRGREWERPCRVDFQEDGGKGGFSCNAGIRLAGGFSRRHGGLRKKSFRLYFRGAYGTANLCYPLFGASMPCAFHCFRVRASGNDQRGAEGRWTLLRDALANSLMRQMGGVYTAWRFALVTLNGRLLGLYDLREHCNDAFLASRFGIADPDLLKVTVWTNRGDVTVKDGDRLRWQEACRVARDPGLSPGERTRRLGALVDLSDLCREVLLRTWGADWDWPQNNRYMFRDRSDPESRFRFVIWDSEWTLGLGGNCDWNVPTLVRLRGRGDPQALMIARLFDDPEWRKGFAAAAVEALNTVLSPENVVRTIGALVREAVPGITIETDLQRDTPTRWFDNVEHLKRFAVRRRDFFLGQVAAVVPECLEVVEFTVERPARGHGSVRVSGRLLEVGDLPWKGVRFAGIPLAVEAVPRAGYVHAGWDPPLPVPGGNDRGDPGPPLAFRGLWRFYAGASPPPTRWKEFDFEEGTWKKGYAPLGYGDADIQTDVGFGENPARKRMAYYFRRRVHLPPGRPYAGLRALLVCDDGAVLYVNGKEAGRINMPGGAVGHTTPSAAPAAMERAVHRIDIPPRLLRPGDNLLAVEVHQCSPQSSDVAFDLSLVSARPLVYRPVFRPRGR
jgi:hypothetical protein